MTMQRKNLGSEGEDLALKYLMKKGYTLVKRNLRLKCGEIDLLMEDGDDLVICEVKTKSSDAYGVPQEEVDFFKKKKLVQLGKALWQLYPNHSVRIDVLAVYSDTNKVEHLVNAVEEY